MAKHALDVEVTPAEALWPEEDLDFRPDPDWAERRGLFEPWYGKFVMMRPGGRQKWISAWTKRGLRRKILRYLDLHHRVTKDTVRWLDALVENVTFRSSDDPVLDPTQTFQAVR